MNINEIKILIAQNKIEQAFILFSEKVKGNNYENDFILLQSRSQRLQSEEQNGLLSKDEVEIFRNRIVVAFLHILDDFYRSHFDSEKEKIITFLYFDNNNSKLNVINISKYLSKILNIELNDFDINIDFGKNILELILPIKETILLFGLYRIAKKTIFIDTVEVIDIRLPLIEIELTEKKMLQYIANLEKEFKARQIIPDENIHQILEQFAPGSRALILMYLIDDLNISDISTILDIKSGIIKKELYKNTKELRVKIDRYIRKNNLELYYILERYEI